MAKEINALEELNSITEEIGRLQARMEAVKARQNAPQIKRPRTDKETARLIALMALERADRQDIVAASGKSLSTVNRIAAKVNAAVNSSVTIAGGKKR